MKMPCSEKLGRSRVIALVCMPEYGHFQCMRSIISHLAASGFRVVVLTHSNYQSQVREAGGVFFDLFGRAPIESADATSVPVPCRYVTYASHFADLVIRELKRMDASLVVADSFSIVATVAARELQIPYVSVFVGHNMNPIRHLEIIQQRSHCHRISESCHNAVGVLRNRFGLENANVFSYVTTVSPYLNICCEPAQFLTPEEQMVFQPVAFFGSIYVSSASTSLSREGTYFKPKVTAGVNVFLSFGTVIWRYFSEQAMDVAMAIAREIAKRPQFNGVFSLGGSRAQCPSTVSILESSVSVHDFVDQPRVLGESDLFVTHHGLNSTHESILSGVPMLSYPFFADQPDLAAKCQNLGFALPIVANTMECPQEDQVKQALDAFCDCRKAMKQRLEQGRLWEIEVIKNRPHVVKQIADLR